MAALPPGDLTTLKVRMPGSCTLLTIIQHAELQKLCKERSLPAKVVLSVRSSFSPVLAQGTKGELIARLTAHAGGGEAPALTSTEGNEAAESSPAKKQALESSTTGDASPAKAADSSMEVATPVAPPKKEATLVAANPPAAPAAAAAEIKATDAMVVDQPKAEAVEPEKVVESDSLTKTMPAPRPAPRLVSASVNTSTPDTASTETEKPTPPPVVRELVVRKRKTAEVEEAREVKEIPSSKPASPVLRVTNLVRPFTVPALKELLEKHGKILRFWMDPIKTCCVAEYGSVQEASATRNAVHGTVWPPQFSHKKLSVEFAPVAELDALLRPAAPPSQKQKPESKAAANNKYAAVASPGPAAAASAPSVPAEPPKRTRLPFSS